MSTSPSKGWREVVPEGEEARLRELALSLRALQKSRDGEGPSHRALHNKSNLDLLAELEIRADLPEAARVALFAAPKTYKAFVRFSNGGVQSQSDRKPDVRGIAVKVLGVPGKKLIPGMEDETTQDLLAIRDPSVTFKTADEFVAAVRAGVNPLAVFGFFRAAGFFRGLGILKQVSAALKRPIASIATTTYFSALPIRLGEHAVKFKLAPRLAASEGATPDDLGAELAERVRREPVIWDLAIQFFVDETKTPIEDATVEWTSDVAPWLDVATLTLVRQDPSSERGKKVTELVESMSFDPWHALEEMRPLGHLMRARNHAYRESTIARSAAKEPRGEDWGV